MEATVQLVKSSPPDRDGLVFCTPEPAYPTEYTSVPDNCRRGVEKVIHMGLELAPLSGRGGFFAVQFRDTDEDHRPSGVLDVASLTQILEA